VALATPRRLAILVFMGRRDSRFSVAGRGGSAGWARAAGGVWLLVALFLPASLAAHPRYRHNLARHYDGLLPKALEACTTCHLRSGPPTSSGREEMPPHNAFGASLLALKEAAGADAGRTSLAARLRAVAGEDADGDGAPNEIELLSGRSPGDPRDTPAGTEFAAAREKQEALARDRARGSWDVFAPVARPPVPAAPAAPAGPSAPSAPSAPAGRALANPIDIFLAREHARLGLAPRPEAPKATLLRRVSIDLTGLAPAPDEIRAFLADPSADAYEKAVDRLLESPRHGERWGRHWMDVWRYSDWAGWGEQVRDSQPHIWRWRDWIVESLNADKPYDRMVLEMLAGDELAPGDPDVARATGYLVRSFKLLSREAWMQEAVDHAAQGFLGLTFGCARCHDHLYDPITQRDYYRFRAIFEPYNVRLDRRPGELDLKRDGIAIAFDAAPEAKTYFYVRGDERKADKDHALEPGVPAALGGPEYRPEPVALPRDAYAPDRRAHVVEETLAASERSVREARAAFAAAVLKPSPAGAAPEPQAERQAQIAEAAVPVAEARHAALAAVLRVEALEDEGAREKDAEAWTAAATEAARAERWANLLAARRAVLVAELVLADAPPEGEVRKKADEKLAEARKALDAAKTAAGQPPSPEFTRRDVKTYPAASSGRRLALARWITSRSNPLAARVALNHIWLRHFGQGLVPSAADFGLNGRAPVLPELLDWLAAELMEPSDAAGVGAPWSMRRIHRLIVTSAAYRRASTPDEANLAIDPENRFLWRMPSRRLEAEAVRDNLLVAAGRLDETRGGPELDQGTILETARRSLYYRNAPEKQAELLKVFDMAAPGECYERRPSVVPQQALALANSQVALASSRSLARALGAEPGCDDAAAFATAAFVRVLSREPSAAELEAALAFLAGEERALGSRAGGIEGTADPQDLSRPSADVRLRVREGLVHALFNHNDFVTLR
jgi:hypothetical protein